MRFFSLLATGICAAAMTASAQNASDQTRAETQVQSQATTLVLAELFTSQACSSCPAAERLFNELAATDGVVAIQWHVDYWNDLVHGRAGEWEDPFSSPGNTRRQRDYNYALRGTGSVYTPQAVIGGVMETTGSRRETIEKMIGTAPAANVVIDVAREADGYRVNVDAVDPDLSGQTDAEIMIVTLLRKSTTNIRGGENVGLTVQNLNVAVASDTLGPWAGSMESYRADIMPEGYTCAVIVQEKSKGRVLGASYCPS